MMHKVTRNIDGVMVLQNCMDVLKSEPGPCTGTCQISSDDGGNEVTVKRGEEVTCIKVEEDSWPATSTGIETEPAVSCVRVCVCAWPPPPPYYSHDTHIQNFLSIGVFPSA
jgi:hypothetical protein